MIRAQGNMKTWKFTCDECGGENTINIDDQSGDLIRDITVMGKIGLEVAAPVWCECCNHFFRVVLNGQIVLEALESMKNGVESPYYY